MGTILLDEEGLWRKSKLKVKMKRCRICGVPRRIGLQKCEVCNK